MNPGLDIELVKQNYQRLSDKELVRIATHDAVGLTAQSLEVVKNEIERRGLGSHLAKAAEAQNKQYSLEELDEYCNLLQGLPCPSCGDNYTPLNATLISETMSFLIITHHKKQLKVACPSCLDKAINSALIKTFLLGWWGIPWGPIRSIQAIVRNLKSQKAHHIETPNNYLRSFTIGNIGLIESHRNDPGSLQKIISPK